MSGCKRSGRHAASRKRLLRIGHGPERLEARLLLTANHPEDSALWPLSHQVCGCPVCSGLGLDTPAPAAEVGSGPAGAASPLSSLPLLSSLPSARAKLYLDFDGHYQATWGAWSNALTPAYDLDGDPTTFSASELSAIYEIWARVAEDFAPFQIDVTTIDPQSQANGVVAHIVIGGSYSDWFGSPAGGVAYVGGFYNSAPNVGYVFENNLGGGLPRYVAEAASHEAGHLFGLAHQALWNGNTLVQSYNSGTSSWAPIMGVGYSATRTTWHNGPTDAGPTAYQDDMAILASALNGFGYRADDYGNTLATAAALPITSGQFQLSGLIHQTSDLDLFSFTTAGGPASFQLSVAPYGPNLDAVLELWDASGSVIASSNPASSFGASLSLTLTSGTYYLVARSAGGYGNVGQYTLAGTVAGVSASPLQVQVGGSTLADGAAYSFGSTPVGTPVVRVFTITHVGTEPLTLASLAGTLPAGFSLVQDLGQTMLAPGETTQFAVQLDATAAGTFGGMLSLRDASGEQTWFRVQLGGTVTDPLASLVRVVDNGGDGYQRSGSWSTLSGRGHEGDIDQARKGNGSSAATWTFGDLPAGQYRVWVTWSAHSKNASNAPFTVLDGNSVRTTVRINERLAPSGLIADGTRWKMLTTVAVQSGTLVVRLTNAANGQVVADAVRIERVVSSAPPRGSLLGPEGSTGGSVRDAMEPVLLAQTWSTSETGPASHGASAVAGGMHGTDFRSAGESGRAAGRWSTREGGATALIGLRSAASENWEPTLHLLAQHRSQQAQQGDGELGWAVDQLMAEDAELSGLWAS